MFFEGSDVEFLEPFELFLEVLFIICLMKFIEFFFVIETFTCIKKEGNWDERFKRELFFYDKEHIELVKEMKIYGELN